MAFVFVRGFDGVCAHKVCWPVASLGRALNHLPRNVPNKMLNCPRGHVN